MLWKDGKSIRSAGTILAGDCMCVMICFSILNRFSHDYHLTTGQLIKINFDWIQDHILEQMEQYPASVILHQS